MVTIDPMPATIIMRKPRFKHFFRPALLCALLSLALPAAARQAEAPPAEPAAPAEQPAQSPTNGRPEPADTSATPPADTGQDPQPEFQGPPVTLRLDLRPGQDFHMRGSSKYRITNNFADRQVEVRQVVETLWIFAVEELLHADDAAEDAAPTGYKLTVTLDSLRVLQEAGERRLRYDSKAPSGPETLSSPETAGFAALVGNSFGVTLGPDGRVRAMEGAEELISRNLDRLGAPRTPIREKVKEALTPYFGEAALRDVVEAIIGILPAEDQATGAAGGAAPPRITPGQAWRVPAAVAGQLVQAETLRATLREVDPDTRLATLDISGTVDATPESPPFGVGDARLAMTLRGQVTGGAEIDTRTGWTRKRAQKLSLTGKVRAVENRYDLAQPQWDLQVEGVVSFERVFPNSR
jgi:hypothetical protein